MSIIIEKGRIQNDAQIILPHMEITDSFLMFMANCDKMGKVRYLDISSCRNVT